MKDEKQERLKAANKLISRLKGEWLVVEGQRDKKALQKLGMKKILTISGNLRKSVSALKGKAERVYVLTDLDRRGEQLARLAKDELEANSIRADLEARKRLAGIFRLRFFEDANRRYEKLVEEAGGA